MEGSGLLIAFTNYCTSAKELPIYQSQSYHSNSSICLCKTLSAVDCVMSSRSLHTVENPIASFCSWLFNK
jgi:hypothetical protein